MTVYPCSCISDCKDSILISRLSLIICILQDRRESVADVKDTSERQQWTNGVEFLMSCIAMSVGLGNVWRFPFTAYKNGGGAFLIPYIVVLFLIGKPIYYMEMALGQFVSGGPVKVWALSPALKGKLTASSHNNIVKRIS